jgi:hypothetical protein
MTTPAELVKSYLASLKPSPDGQILPRADLLAADANFTALVKIAGRDAVIARMTADDTGRIYREMTWSEPDHHGAALKVVGKAPSGVRLSGVILLFHFSADKIALIQQQPLAEAPIPATELRLSQRLKELVSTSRATGHPMLVAYVDESGQPNLSFRGSLQIFSDDQLAIWVRQADGSFIRSIAKNPKVALMYRDEETRATFQFQGRAWVAAGEAERRKVYDTMSDWERAHDYAQIGVALVIDLDRIEGFFGITPEGPVGQLRMLRA